MRFLALMLMLLAIAAVTGAQDAPKSGDAPRPDKAKDAIADDIKPEALWDGRKIVPFHALDYPKMVKATEADFLDDNEYVLALTVKGESRAYPTRFVWWHHFVNDKIGKPGEETPVLISYCSVCNTGIRYDPTVGGKPRLFDFYGLYNAVAIMCDRETESVWLQVSGRAVKGPMLGAQLKPGPLLDTTWGKWKKLHPDTLVMSPDNEYKSHYQPKGKAEPRGYEKFPAPFFRPTVVNGDKRLPPFDKVLGVALPQMAADGKLTSLRRAYPIKALKEANGVLNDRFGETPVVALLELDTDTANAFSRTLEGKTLTFEARKQADDSYAIYDKETGTRWNIEGKGEEGALAGKTLDRLENHLSQWYGWAAYFPETTLYGRTDPPQPGIPFDDPPKPTN